MVTIENWMVKHQMILVIVFTLYDTCTNRCQMTVISVNRFIRLDNCFNNNSSNITKLIRLPEIDVSTSIRGLHQKKARSWYSVLPVLDTMGRCRVKKAVVSVTELIVAPIPIHSMLAFLAEELSTSFF